MTNTAPDALMDVLRFTAADLAANRDGRLSEPQKDRLARSWRRMLWIVIAVIMGIGFGATLILYFAQENDSTILSIIGIILTIINALVVGLGAQSYLRTSRDLRDGRVAVLDGVVSHTIRVAGRVATYILKVDGQEVVVAKPVFFAFEDGKPYRLYRAPNTKTLFSAEPSA